MVDFVLVGSLVVAVVLGIAQLALTLFVRTTLIDCAAEGARYAALYDGDLDLGAERTRQLIASSLSASFAEDVTAQRTIDSGVEMVTIEVTAPLPVLGLFGPSGALSVTGRAVQE